MPNPGDRHIPAAEHFADALHGRPPAGSGYDGYAGRWNRAFHTAMGILVSGGTPRPDDVKYDNLWAANHVAA